MSYRCTFCSKVFPEIPEDAEKIGKANGSTQMIRLTDGSVHNLVSTIAGKRRKKEMEDANAV